MAVLLLYGREIVGARGIGMMEFCYVHSIGTSLSVVENLMEFNKLIKWRDFASRRRMICPSWQLGRWELFAVSQRT